MKKSRFFMVGALALSLLASSGCSSMSNTGKGALIGGGGGGALGAGIGALIGGGKGAAIGAAIGATVGTGAGALIGNKMDKQKQELEASLANSANVTTVTDQNGLPAIKVTFDGGILFPTNGTSINASAKKHLSSFATSLIQNPQTNVQIYGFTDNKGSLEVNQRVSDGRASAVRSYLANSGVASSRLSAQGLPMQNYVASNDTEAGRAQNRRVEIYISANADMIQAAENGTLAY